jgi:hypothetical protein
MADLEQLQDLAQDPRIQIAAGFVAFWALGAWRAFKAEYSASQWALQPQRHKALKALAYAGAFPFRVVFAIFTGLVEALVWALILAFVWLLWRTLRG